MADKTTYLMLDDVSLIVEEPHAAEAHAIAGYVNGRYANWPAIVQKYGPSGKHLLSIDTQGNPNAGAQCLDVETGDARIDQVVQWFKETLAAGHALKDLRWFPKIYVQASNLAAVNEKMNAAGIARDEYMLWSAHFTDKAHICSTEACGYPQADATQYTKNYEGVSLDASLCYAYFFAGPPETPVQPPEPKPEPPKPPVPVVPPKPEPKPPVVPPKPVVTRVYVMETLSAEAGKKISLPEGTVLFIPHDVTST